MNPSTDKQWLEVARERASDAEAISKDKPKSVGAVYMAGYAIECSLKAFLQKQNKGFPKHGKEGHNLQKLWKSSQFRLGDFNDSKGSKTFFIQHWDTSLRYENELNSTLEVSDLVQGAKELTGWIQKQIRRSKSRRHR